MFTKSGANLADVIKNAINDHVITAAEYDEIMQLAHQDSIIDGHEQVLLKEGEFHFKVHHLTDR